jgi:rhodanese-related sulfurtransferase
LTRISNILSFRYLAFAAVLLLLLTAGAYAHGTQEEGLISPANLNKTSSSFKIIDLRSRQKYKAAHIPGAYSLPLRELSQDKLKKLGIQTGEKITLYSTSESAAEKGKMLLGILGYQDIKILAGGFVHWKEDGQPTVEGWDDHPETSTAANDPSPAPIISPATHDFGIIAQKDGVVSTVFDLENPTSKEMVITEITTSCGCTTAEVDIKTIPPGATRKLTVFFNPNFHKEPEGKFSRTVFIELASGVEIQAGIEVEIAK